VNSELFDYLLLNITVHNIYLLLHNATPVSQNQAFQLLMNLCILWLFKVSFLPFLQQKFALKVRQFYLILAFRVQVQDWLKMDFDKLIGAESYCAIITTAMMLNIC
jgi:hypothetical protein